MYKIRDILESCFRVIYIHTHNRRTCYPLIQNHYQILGVESFHDRNLSLTVALEPLPSVAKGVSRSRPSYTIQRDNHTTSSVASFITPEVCHAGVLACTVLTLLATPLAPVFLLFVPVLSTLNRLLFQWSNLQQDSLNHIHQAPAVSDRYLDHCLATTAEAPVLFTLSGNLCNGSLLANVWCGNTCWRLLLAASLFALYLFLYWWLC